ncbi:hypothetical protein ACTG9Q_17950 [Actinokineospora sp. 24-640]
MRPRRRVRLVDDIYANNELRTSVPATTLTHTAVARSGPGMAPGPVLLRAC